ncbi:hypothetical protein F5X97DRAFT_325683 [Nemania serpens]|nr:hypothetical protein F5X97DRAFT_325683 [Nemania serpens]
MHVPLLPFLAAVRVAALPQGDSSVDTLDVRTEIPGDYQVGDIEWRGFEDFGDDQVFTGTIEASPAPIPCTFLKYDSNSVLQNVIQQMRQIKGIHYTPRFVTEAENRTLEDKHQHDTASDRVECGGDFADPDRINQGIDYLKHLPDSSRCTNPAKTCGRISCSWNSGIWWCNQKDMHADVYKCKTFGAYAARVVDECTIWDTNPRVSGKNTDDELKLSVVVAKAKC